MGNERSARMARITDPTWPVAPTTPIFMADQANAVVAPAARIKQPAARRSWNDRTNRAGRYRHGADHVGDEPPVAAVDALEHRVDAAADPERPALRSADQAHVGHPVADRTEHRQRA